MKTPNTGDKKTNIQKLERLADEILKLKQERGIRRPILIEFCGSPKAGKTTCITSLNIFLKRNGFRTEVLSERASVCPIGSKTHPFFNTWTLCSAAAEIIQHLDSGRDKVDIIIADRGIFDALCWFEWLNCNPDEDNQYLDDKSYEALRAFSLMDMWISSFDLIYVFNVGPDTSLQREYANLLTEKTGSIMNEQVLEGYNSAVKQVMRKYGKHFRKIEVMDTSDVDPDRVSFDVTLSILGILKEMLVEKIGYFDSTLKKSFKPGINEYSVIKDQKLQFDNRDIVEEGNSVQPIPIAVITNKKKDRVLVVKKNPIRTHKNSPESNRLLLYVGGHVRQEDANRPQLLDILKNTLHREIQEELGESITAKQITPFLIYTPISTKSKKHLGVCYIITMDFENKRFKPTPDEFIMKTGKSKSGHILLVKDILKSKEKLESWSTAILKHVFDIEDIKQEEIFQEI